VGGNVSLVLCVWGNVSLVLCVGGGCNVYRADVCGW